MEPLQEFCLENLAGGGAVEQFNEQITKILGNIRDPNTEAKSTRKVTMVVAFRPSEDRGSASVSVDVTAKLAAPRALGSQIFIGERDGRPVAATHDPRQGTLFPTEVVDRDGVVTPISRKQG